VLKTRETYSNPNNMSDVDVHRKVDPSLRTIPSDLVHYFKYASSAYSLVCPRPNGSKLVIQLSNPSTNVQGFVARDDLRKEVVVALRGSTSVIEVMLDTQVTLVPFICPGCRLPAGTRVHSGFLTAWDSIVLEVQPVIEKLLSVHEGYSVVTVGHSLGGAISLLAALHLKENFRETRIRTYSYGAPRTGNKLFAEYVNTTFGKNAYRIVHSNDGVPTMIPKLLGYHHHGVEYWQHEDPPSEETTVKCDINGEDPCCSASIPSQGINAAHTSYFGILAVTPFCL